MRSPGRGELPMSEPGASPAKGKLTIVCEGFHSVRRTPLRGYATIVIRELRLRINDVAIYQREDGQRWATLPTNVQTEVVKGRSRQGDLRRNFEIRGPAVVTRFLEACLRGRRRIRAARVRA